MRYNHHQKAEHEKRFDFKSIKFKMWLYFVIFAAMILAILWGLQIIFLQSYYQGMKTREIFETAEEIISNYDTENFVELLGQTA